MTLKTLIIHKNKILYNILKEISNNLNLNTVYAENVDLNLNDFENYIILTSKKISDISNQVVIDSFPLKLKKLVEIININFLKQEYNIQSSFSVGKYKLDLNSRTLRFENNDLNLTEMESNIILFLKKSKQPVNIKELQKSVWGHMPDLETHTVETHIYRLRKKIKDQFQDNNFIKSLKDGYQII
jgi:hypothetical protein